MEGFVKLVGVLMVVAGVIYFMKPNLMKKSAAILLKEKGFYIAGIISFIIGMIFLGAASQCTLRWLVRLFGVLAIVKGILAFTLGQKRITSLFNGLMQKSPKALRSIVVIKIVLGILLIYSA